MLRLECDEKYFFVRLITPTMAKEEAETGVETPGIKTVHANVASLARFPFSHVNQLLLESILFDLSLLYGRVDGKSCTF
jgi:hypothetical protein